MNIEKKTIQPKPITESEIEMLREKSIAEIDHFLTDPKAGYQISKWAWQKRLEYIFDSENEKQHVVERVLYNIAVFSFPDLFNRAKMEGLKSSLLSLQNQSKSSKIAP